MKNRHPLGCLFACCFTFLSIAPQTRALSNWTAINPLQTGRQSYTLTVLKNSKILIAGGANTTIGAMNTAELYDPQTHSFTRSAHLMNLPRFGHTATLLPDGMVLITGGLTPKFGNGPIVCNQPTPLAQNGQLLVPMVATSCAELYDPLADNFIPVGSMIAARTNHTATLIDAILINGLSPPVGLRVLIAGGDDGNNSYNSLEYYNFYTQKFELLTATLSTARSNHTATWLPSLDRILIAGGHTLTSQPGVLNANLATAEIFDPANKVIVRAGPGPMVSARDGHIAIGLKDGTVLLAGGESTVALDTAEIYDPMSSTFTGTPGRMTTARLNHAAAMLPNGSVLIAGGIDGNGGLLASTEVFNPASQLFSSTAPMLKARTNFSMGIAVNSVEVLATGGGFFIQNITEAMPDSEVFVQVQKPPRMNYCLTHPLVCQFLHPHSPFLLMGNVREAMAIAEFPPLPEVTAKDRNMPFSCRLAISGLKDGWDTEVFNKDDMPLNAERNDSRDPVVLTLTFKDAASLRSMLEGAYVVFEMTPKGVVRQEYSVSMKADVTPRPDLAKRAEK